MSEDTQATTEAEAPAVEEMVLAENLVPAGLTQPVLVYNHQWSGPRAGLITWIHDELTRGHRQVDVIVFGNGSRDGAFETICFRNIPFADHGVGETLEQAQWCAPAFAGGSASGPDLHTMARLANIEGQLEVLADQCGEHHEAIEQLKADVSDLTTALAELGPSEPTTETETGDTDAG